LIDSTSSSSGNRIFLGRHLFFSPSLSRRPLLLFLSLSFFLPLFVVGDVSSLVETKRL